MITMAFVFSLSDPLVITGIIGGIILVVGVLAALYLQKRRQAGSPGEGIPVSDAGRLAYQPEARPIPAVSKGAIPKPARKSPIMPSLKEISLLEDRKDISESLQALKEKYSLDAFTIATADGLVFASGGGTDSQTDAAQYSEIFNNDPLSETPGVVLTGIEHKGSSLVLIIRTQIPVPDEIRMRIENDTKDILNWWI
ncbi:MAG: hypothetical protein CVV32_12190 [Methanomicrobiales archaeon HGW-Methanomicrobiales-3]|jgi:hypothetical protein|nr:MAG: hypothetical protein CVV32_12190 [Methanomicrobiales archaeon HGW-Methanomicrobiales-3]